MIDLFFHHTGHVEGFDQRWHLFLQDITNLSVEAFFKLFQNIGRQAFSQTSQGFLKDPGLELLLDYGVNRIGRFNGSGQFKETLNQVVLHLFHAAFGQVLIEQTAKRTILNSMQAFFGKAE